MRRTARGRYRADCERMAEPPYTGRDQVVVRSYIERVEAQILDAPEDWLWLHQRWKRQKPVYS